MGRLGMGPSCADGEEGPKRPDRTRIAFPPVQKPVTGHSQPVQIPIRIAGIDAPECAHFGRPAQPYSSEALEFLSSYILGRRVRARIYRRDQYDRVVATVWVRRWLLFRRDVGLEMLQRGLATTYEAKTGAEFGGADVEEQYRAAEAQAREKRKGLWSQADSGRRGWLGLGKRITEEKFESPREYKMRYSEAEKASKSVKGGGDMT